MKQLKVAQYGYNDKWWKIRQATQLYEPITRTATPYPINSNDILSESNLKLSKNSV